MNPSLSFLRPAPWAPLVCLAVAATLLAGCQKRSTTEETPTGTVTTTTIEPTASVRQQMQQAASATAGLVDRAASATSGAIDKAQDAAGRAADRVQESASSGALARAGQAASGAMSRAGDALGDAAITAKVKAALLADARVKGLQVDVDTSDGAVTLTGSADAQPGLDAAAEIARRIDGVKSVENRMTVKKSG